MSDIRPRLILHVGAYKTATSTLQSLFSLFEDEIADRFGIQYAKTLRRTNSGSIIIGHPRVDSLAHHMISHLLRRDDDAGRAELVRQVRATGQAFFATDCRSLLVSSELLSFCSHADKALLLEHMDAFDVHVVYAVRNPVDYVESMNNQALKSGERRRADTELPRMHFLQNIQDWAGLVGPERLHVLPFSSAYFKAFCAQFLAVFDDPAFTAFAQTEMPRTNASISAEGARIRAMFNAHLPRPRAMDRRQRHAVTRIVSAIDARLERRTPLVTLDTEDRRAILAANRADMDEICDRFLPRDLWHMFTVPERGLIATRTRLDDVLFTAKDLSRIADGLMRARALFAETPEPELELELEPEPELE